MLSKLEMQEKHIELTIEKLVAECLNSAQIWNHVTNPREIAVGARLACAAVTVGSPGSIVAILSPGHRRPHAGTRLNGMVLLNWSAKRKRLCGQKFNNLRLGHKRG